MRLIAYKQLIPKHAATLAVSASPNVS